MRRPRTAPFVKALVSALLAATATLALPVAAPFAATAPAPPTRAPNAIGAAVSPVTVTDISPDAACCPTSNGGPAEGGQMDAIAVDPTNPNIVYVAGEAGGVWKTIDGGSNWSRAGSGLPTGETNVAIGYPVGATSLASGALAVDASDPRRLLYGLAPDDLGLGIGGAEKGGLYASLTGGGGWAHVDLPGCANPQILGAAFAGGRAFAGTNCGLAISTDPLLRTWSIVHPDGGPEVEAINGVATVGNVVFVCDAEQRVLRSGNLGDTWGPNPPIALTGRCDGLAAAPDSTTRFLAMVFHSKGDWRVVLGDTSTRATGELQRVPPILCNSPPVPCNPSGRPYVYTARRPQVAAGLGPGRSYSVFAANGAYFYEYGFTSEPVHPIWRQFGPMHIDSHGLGIPANYDPEAGRCRVFVANDGGVYRADPTGSPCSTYRGPFVKAMHGLHGYGSFGLALIPQSTCPSGVAAPCPALYLPSNDNGTFGSVTGGHGSGAWHDMDCCGDSGVALTDWRQRNRLLLPRDADYRLYVSSDGAPPIWQLNVTQKLHIGTDYLSSGTTSDWVVVQVQSLPGETVPSAGDYIALRSPSRFSEDPDLDTVNDTIVRNRAGTATGWKQIGPALKPSSVWTIQAAGGHTGTTVYVLLANAAALGDSAGKVLRGVADKTGAIASWANASTGLTRAFDILADPFNRNVVYATDLGNTNSLTDDRIMATTDAGTHWRLDPDLTRLASGGGRYRMACFGAGGANAGDNGFRYQCTLAAVAFDPNHASYRFAVLDPAGAAFSRDAGQHWMPLSVTDAMDRPDAGLFDPTANPATGEGSLYVARHGRGLIRVDAKWSTLEAMLFQLHDVPPGYTVSAIDETTGRSIRLLRDVDGVYRGYELFDSSSTPATHTFRYFVSETRRSTQRFSRTVTSADVAAGVTTVDSFLVAESAGDQASANVSADFNHDGFDDLAVGVPGEDVGSIVDAGAVAVIYGSANGLVSAGNQLWVQSQNGLGGTAEAGDNFGATLAAGDFNGDGFADLAVGVPREDVGTVVDAGVVQVLFGSASGLTASGNLFLQQGSGGIGDALEAGDMFGAALAVGDFGNGSQADIAAGVPGEDVTVGSQSIVDTGAVAVIYGSASGPTGAGSQLFVQGQGGIVGTTEAGDGFGIALAAGDFGGSAQADLAVGVPSEDIGSTPAGLDAGTVNVIYGSASGLTATGNQGFVQGANGMAGGAEAGDGFGSALAAANFGGTAQADLAVGVASEDIGTVVDAGAVGIIYGSASGLVTTGNQLFDQGQLGETVERDDAFGASLAAGDVGGTAEADLAIGVPGEDLGTAPNAISNAGLVTLAFGSAGGLSTSGTQQLSQGTGGFPGTPEAEDAVGSAPAVGSFGKTSESDLAIGVPAEDIGSTVDAGVVDVLYGSPTGVVGTGAQGWVQGQAGLLDTAEAGDGFGESVAG